MHVSDVLADLIAEQQALDDIVAPLTDEQWATPTPSPRWSVADQIAHLAFFDRAAALAITDAEGFVTHARSLVVSMADGGDPDEAGDTLTLGEFRAMSPQELLTAWRGHRATLAAAAAELADDARVGWYGPSMGAKSFLTARLMECWSHGQDVVDAVGAHRPATERLRHIAQLGFITRGWSYVNRRLEVPAGTVALELVAPDGSTWRYGPDDADDVVRGTALDFCLVATQRRHHADTDLAFGPLAKDWLEIAQTFAGTATDGPSPR